MTWTLFALVDILTSSVFQPVTVETSAYSFVFMRFTVTVSAVYRVART